jgi:lipopolysaccharide exporter
MSIQKQAISSGKWVTFSTVFQTVIQFIQIALLARLLDSSAFGVVSMSALFITFCGIFGDLGFSNSIIHKQETDRKILSTIYTVNVLLGVIMFMLINLISPLIVGFYSEPRLAKVLTTTSFMFLFLYFGSVQSILLKKEMRFKAIATIDICGYAVGFPVTVVLAVKGYAELSLVYGGLTTQLVRTAMEMYLGRDLFLPGFSLRVKEIKEHLRFGVVNLGDSFITLIQNNWDNIIIGKILGAKYLGIYTLALQLGYYPVSKLNPLILQVAYPMMAKLKNDVIAFKNSYIQILDILSFINYPLLAGLYITVESVVPLVYGPGWEETFPLIRIFVFVSAISCIAHPLFTIAYSKGKPKYLFYLSLLSLIIKVPLVYFLSSYWHVTGVAVAILITAFINLIINLTMVQTLIGSYFMTFLKNLIKPVSFCLAMAASVLIYRYIFGTEGLSNTFAQIIIGGFTYLLLTLKFKYSYSDIMSFRKAL